MGLRVAITSTDEVFRNKIKAQLEFNGFQECDIFSMSHVSNKKKYVVFEPVTAPVFNKYFEHNYFVTEQDVIDLYDDSLTTEKLLLKLRSPMNSCKYCHLPIYEEWERIGKKSVLSDWIVGDNDYE